MIVKWLDDAVTDLYSLRQYIAQDKPAAANLIAKQILNAVNLLSEQPNLGRPGRVLGIRELVISNTPYIVPYRVKNNSLEILRVLHVAMKWPDKI
jgi:toxin ParE1/3/4